MREKKIERERERERERENDKEKERMIKRKSSSLKSLLRYLIDIKLSKFIAD